VLGNAVQPAGGRSQDARLTAARPRASRRHFVQASVEDEKGQIQLFLNSVPLLSSLRTDEKMVLADAFQEETFSGARGPGEQAWRVPACASKQPFLEPFRSSGQGCVRECALHGSGAFLAWAKGSRVCRPSCRAAGFPAAADAVSP
jgi:hypothetical protein